MMANSNQTNTGSTFSTSPWQQFTSFDKQSVLNPAAAPGDKGTYVWMGVGSGSHPKGRTVQNFKSVEDAYGHFTMLDDDAYNHVAAVYQALNPGKKPTFSNLQSLWKDMVDEAAYRLKIGQPVTPLNAMDEFATRRLQETAAAAGGSDISKTTSFRNESVTLTNPSQAKTLVNNALSQYLGRAATQKEQQAFLAALNAEERKSPSVTSGTQTQTAGGSSTKGVTTGGMSSAQFAQDWALKQQGAGEHVAATTYLDTFLSALANPVNVTGV